MSDHLTRISLQHVFDVGQLRRSSLLLLLLERKETYSENEREGEIR